MTEDGPISDAYDRALRAYRVVHAEYVIERDKFRAGLLAADDYLNARARLDRAQRALDAVGLAEKGDR